MLRTRRPGAISPINTSRAYLYEMLREVAASVSTNTLMLDAGAGDSPYRELFAHTRYEAADVCKRAAHQYAHVNYVCDLTAVPVENERYEFILCTQVLEHVPKPHRVLAEFNRILKPNGLLCFSVPLYFEEHEVPYDYFRYTQFGLRSLCTEAGFVVERLEWVEGYLGTLAHQLNVARHWLPSRPADYGSGMVGCIAAAFSLALRPMFGFLALVFAILDRRHKFTNKGHCINYFVLARKTDAAPQEGGA